MSSNPDHDTLLRLLLLSRDLRFGGRDLRREELPTPELPAATQLTLPSLTPPPIRTPSRRRKLTTGPQPLPSAEDPLLTTFQRRLAAQGRARKGQKAYGYQIRTMLLIVERLCGHKLTCADLMRDEQLLGRVLVDDTAPTLGTRLSKWTLAQRRSAIRDFVTLMRPELFMLLREDPHILLDRALRGVAERVGAGFRLNGGTPRRRGGRVPTSGQIRDVLDAVGRAPGYLGARNRAFLLILAESGARINALRQLDGTDCVEMPNGRLRIFLHEKGKGEPREIELSHDTAAALRAYAVEFNCQAAVRRCRVRVRLGEMGPVWRNSMRGCWSYDDILTTLRTGCRSAEVPTFTPHALRRAFATDAASVLPRHTVAQAGGWKGLERLDDHYVHPRDSTIRDELHRSGHPAGMPMPKEDGEHEPTPSL